MAKRDFAVIAPDARGDLPTVSVRAVADMEIDGVKRAKDEVFYLDRNLAQSLASAGLVKRVEGHEAVASRTPRRK